MEFGDGTIFGFGFDAFNSVAGPSTAQMATSAANIRAAMAAEGWASLLSNNRIYKQIVVHDLKNPSTVDGTHSVDLDGTRTGAELDQSAAVACSFDPDRRYRGGRPKSFAPWGVAGDLTNSQQWGSSFLASCEAAWTNLLIELAATDSGGAGIDALACIFRTGPPYTVISNPGNTRSHSIGTQLDPPLVVGSLGVTAMPRVGSQRRRLG